MTQQELLQFLMQYYPEWSVSKQAYQPTDIGSMNANIDLFKDQSGLVKDWVTGIATGSFDYGLLQPQQTPFEDPAPSNALSQKYRDAKGADGGFVNAKLFEALDAGMTAQQAALTAYVAEAGLDEDGAKKLAEDINANETLPGNYTLKLEMAKSIEKEVAEYADWERRLEAHNAAPPAELTDLQKEMQAAGFSTELTPDSWYSDSIEQDRANALSSSEEFERLRAEQDAFVADEDRFAGSNPHQADLEAFLASQAPGGQVAPGGQAGGPRSDGSIVVNDAFGNPVVVAKEDQAGSPWYSMEGMGGLGDAFGGALDWITQPSGDDAEEARGGIDAQMLADATAGRSLGGMLGARTPQQAPVVPSTIPSQNMQVPFNPDALYSPPPVNTLPDFNGPRGGSPRNGTPSAGGPADAARYQGMAAADWDYQKKMFEQTAGKRGRRLRKDLYDAERAEGEAYWKLKSEQAGIDSARARGESIQQQQFLDRMLGLPRG